jgi:hypothetical protein
MKVKIYQGDITANTDAVSTPPTANSGWVPGGGAIKRKGADCGGRGAGRGDQAGRRSLPWPVICRIPMSSMPPEWGRISKLRESVYEARSAASNWPRLGSPRSLSRYRDGVGGLGIVECAQAMKKRSMICPRRRTFRGSSLRHLRPHRGRAVPFHSRRLIGGACRR